MQKGPVTPKGFRDIDPEAAKKRREIINKISGVLENYGFVSLETPTIEFAETLLGKYGEDEKLIFQFEDRGGRKVALRYDLTVPLARYVANNLGVLNPTFSRYQIGQIFRGENPQKGRYRESTQFDFDTVGISSPAEDAKVVATAVEGIRKIGFDKAALAINDRANFAGMPVEVIRAIDKFYKIGIDGVKAEISSKGLDPKFLKVVDELDKVKPNQNLVEIFKILKDKYSLSEGKDFFFDPTLARGQDYYTGIIFEMKPTGKPEEMTIGGGGRYDNLIGMFAGRAIPAVGFSFGIDRIIDLLP
jgi:histidyl-tRNA synthetase